MHCTSIICSEHFGYIWTAPLSRFADFNPMTNYSYRYLNCLHFNFAITWVPTLFPFLVVNLFWYFSLALPCWILHCYTILWVSILMDLHPLLLQLGPASLYLTIGYYNHCSVLCISSVLSCAPRQPSSIGPMNGRHCKAKARGFALYCTHCINISLC